MHHAAGIACLIAGARWSEDGVPAVVGLGMIEIKESLLMIVVAAIGKAPYSPARYVERPSGVVSTIGEGDTAARNEERLSRVWAIRDERPVAGACC